MDATLHLAFLVTIVIVSTNATPAATPAAVKPLLLTPLLDGGHSEKARKVSKIDQNQHPSIPESHSGFITVDKKLGNHLFFWYFPSPRVNESTPLLIWFNGGPAVSSMLGLLWEHGPIEVFRNDNYQVTYRKRKHTWVGPFSVVYVDNPVGTGYSFTESGIKGYKVTQEGYTDDLVNFVLQFSQMFPEFKERGIYLGGQSYAGKYVPALGYSLHQCKLAKTNRECADLKILGVILGGPYFDPQSESVAFFDYLYALGAISYHDQLRYKKKVKQMYHDYETGNQGNVTFSELFTNLVLLKELPMPSLDNYVTGKEANYHDVGILMHSDEFRKALHVGNIEYHVSNEKLSQLYGPDVMVSTKHKLAVLMDNYKVLVYNGDYDVVVSSVMVETALLSTAWSGQEKYNSSERHVWYRPKMKDERPTQLRGFYSKANKFCRVVVHGAGHQTPHDEPETSLWMVEDFLKHGCINSASGNA